MRHLSTGITALALTAFAIVPASACSWGKSAKAKDNMTVAETTIVPDINTEISIATNDLSDEALKDMILLPETAEDPTK
ncbi:MAG: hypothetical protein ABJL55_02575 [Roseibium sp.]|uniref:hypothetical protein n=1 Tax=Sulfitobacter sp. TaxID=1903071 RepID=UPI0032977B28